MKRKALITLGVIILAALVTFWYVQRPAQAPTTNDTASINGNAPENQSPGLTPSEAVQKNTLVITGQQAGSSVIVDQVNLAENGFVVIYESAAGQPGKVVGSSRLLSPGSKIDLVVTATTKPGTAYVAGLYLDNGDGKFSVATDSSVKNADGQSLTISFTTAK